MTNRIQELKLEGVEFVQELPGPDGQIGHVIAHAPERQFIFLFGFENSRSVPYEK